MIRNKIKIIEKKISESFFDCLFCSKYKGINTLLIAPSANILLNKLGNLKANMNSPEVISTLNSHKELSDMFKFNGTPVLIVGAQIIPGFIELSKLMEILSKEFSDNI